MTIGIHSHSNEDENLLFAVPKKGRIYDKVSKLLNGSGLEYNRPQRLDIGKCISLDVTLVFLPASDIASYVGEGKVDLGITGQDIIAESETNVNQLQLLEFGKCTLCVQAPINSNIKNVIELSGKRIVTSFPKITKKYFKQLDTMTGKKTSIKYVSGSVEAACGLGLADGIVDLVETGTTMKAANLEKISVILDTQAVLICNPLTKHKTLVHKIHQRILGYLTALKYSMITYNIQRSKLLLATKITPGRKAPTVNPLEKDDFVAVSAMILKEQEANIMDQLMDIGASDILIFNIENCRA